MSIEIELFLNWSVIIFSLFLLLPNIEQLIDFSSKIITWIIKNFVKIFIIFYAPLTLLLWIIVITITISKSVDFYFNHNYHISYDDITNITISSIKKIL